MIDARGGVLSPIAAEIADAAPKQCQDCHTVVSEAMRLSAAVLSETINIEGAQAEIAGIIRGRCLSGPIDHSIRQSGALILASPECGYR